MITVHVNGRPIQPPVTPLEQASHVLLPARAVFAALGASVDFDARTGRIGVHRGLHFVNVTLGSRRAYVDNVPVALDVPPQTLGGVTYLPLRFVAEALGGRVHYLARRDVVDVEDPEAPGSSVGLFRRAFSPAAPSATGPTVEYRHPGPGEFVTGAYPSISALVRTRSGTAANIASVRLFLDGQDVSAGLVLAGGAIAYTPGNALAPGMHQIVIRGQTAGGRVFASEWTFAEVPVSTGAPPGVQGYQAPAFSALGTRVTAPGGTLQFGLATTVAGSGYVTICGYSRQYPLVPSTDQFHYFATVAPPAGLFAPACQAAAYFTDRNGSVNLFTLPTPLQIDTRPKP